jgi:hypothetical protein
MNNLEKEFVSYEIALDMKSIGFDEPCFGYYRDEYNCKNNPITYPKYTEQYDIDNDEVNFNNALMLAPTFSQAFRWFREKHKLHSGIYPYYDEYEYQIKDFNSSKNIPLQGGIMSYEEAELACLKKLIEITKNK